MSCADKVHAALPSAWQLHGEGEPVRRSAIASSPSGKKQDWHKLVKFVQFAYRRRYIPGTNLTLYMVARGRQPLSSNEADLVDEGEAVPTGASLDEHNKELKKNLELASTLLTQARGAVLRERRIKFNQAKIETVFEPGDSQVFQSHGPLRRRGGGGRELVQAQQPEARGECEERHDVRASRRRNGNSAHRSREPDCAHVLDGRSRILLRRAKQPGASNG